MGLAPGAKAPAFEAETDGGGKVSLKDYSGKWIILYFYPRDNTSGCTKQACGFRDSLEMLTKLGTEVLGVSPDKVSSHDKFKEKYNLNFRLISDPDKSICELYDIIGEKKMCGKTYMGVRRTTYIIAPDGIIAHTFNNVRVAGHVDSVMEKLKELQAGQ